MHHTHAPHTGASFIRHRITRTLRRLAVGALGALALSTMIPPAQATALDLHDYTLQWTGNNGYSMEGTMSVNLNTPAQTITESQIWDMSVSFFGSEHNLLGTWIQKDHGTQIYDYLTFSFDRQTLQVSESVDVGADSGSESRNEYYLYNPEGLALYSVDLGNFVSYGGTIFLTPEKPPIDEPPTPPANTAPTLTFPTTTIVAEATNPAGAQVSFEVSASDAEDTIAPTATALPPSGSMFHLGDTTVNVSATDSGGLSAQGSFIVHVQDTTGPVISVNECPISVALGDDFQDYGASAYDAVDQWVSVQSSGRVDSSTEGTYTITYTAKDCHGNEATPVTRTVQVVDPMPKIAKTRFDGGNFEGQADFNVTAHNSITGVINADGHMYRAAFPFSKRQQVVTFRGAKGVTVEANITLSVDPSGEPMFVVQAANTTLELHPTMYSAKKPAPKTVAGTYTAVLRGDHGVEKDARNIPNRQGPIGSGIATFNVNREGRVTMVGRTPEGNAISGGSYLIRPTCGCAGSIVLRGAEYAAPAEFHLYSGLYAAAHRGDLSGTFILDRSSAEGSLTGEFHWQAPSGALVLYPQGIDTWGVVVGGRFEPATPEGSVGLGFSFEKESAYVVSGSVLPAPLSSVMSTRGVPQPLEVPLSIDLRCRYVPATGMLSGRGSGARSFQAIWLQEQGVFEGLNTNGNRTLPGRVEMMEYTPQPQP